MYAIKNQSKEEVIKMSDDSSCLLKIHINKINIVYNREVTDFIDIF